MPREVTVPSKWACGVCGWHFRLRSQAERCEGHHREDREALKPGDRVTVTRGDYGDCAVKVVGGPTRRGAWLGETRGGGRFWFRKTRQVDWDSPTGFMQGLAEPRWSEGSDEEDEDE